MSDSLRTCEADTLHGIAREINAFTKHWFNFNVIDKKATHTKSNIYKIIPLYPSPKTGEWIKCSTRAFFSFCKYYILQKHTAWEKNASKRAQKQEKYNPIHFAHLLHNNTQWSLNEMTSFTIFMAFCLRFYTIYNHFNFIF